MISMYYTKANFPIKRVIFNNCIFFSFEDSHEISKFADLAKLLTLIQIEFFQFLSKFCTN